MADIRFTLNGKEVAYAGSATDRLLDVLRNEYRMSAHWCLFAIVLGFCWR